MREYLAKALSVLKQVSLALITVIGRVVALLQSVAIDQPRGVLLGIGFQLLVVAAVLATFRASVTRAHPTAIAGPAGAETDEQPAAPADERQ